MALDDSQILVESYTAAKGFVRNGSLSADDKAILESYPREIFDHKDLPVRKTISDRLFDRMFSHHREEKTRENSTCFFTQSRQGTRTPLQ